MLRVNLSFGVINESTHRRLNPDPYMSIVCGDFPCIPHCLPRRLGPGLSDLWPGGRDAGFAPPEARRHEVQEILKNLRGLSQEIAIDSLISCQKASHLARE